MKNILIILIIAWLILQLTSAAIGQGPPPPPDEGDPDAPLDGGLGLLVALASAYGIKKVGRKYKASTHKPE